MGLLIEGAYWAQIFLPSLELGRLDPGRRALFLSQERRDRSPTRVFRCLSPSARRRITHRGPVKSPAAETDEGLGSKQAAMDSFSSSSGSGNPNPEAFMEQIKAQLAQAYAQELLEVRSLLISPYLASPFLAGLREYVWMTQFSIAA
jgi:hypothetical protein